MGPKRRRSSLPEQRHPSTHHAARRPVQVLSVLLPQRTARQRRTHHDAVNVRNLGADGLVRAHAAGRERDDRSEGDGSGSVDLALAVIALERGGHDRARRRAHACSALLLLPGSRKRRAHSDRLSEGLHRVMIEEGEVIVGGV